MDASAYLTRQGWRGKGHALHPSGRGIKKPLLVSKKESPFGIGKKKVDVHADQWWSRAFDAGLKGLDVNTAGAKPVGAAVEAKPVRSSDLSLLRLGAGKWAGLYDGFVKGKSLEGTISSTPELPKAKVPERALSSEDDASKTTARDTNSSRATTAPTSETDADIRAEKLEKTKKKKRKQHKPAASEPMPATTNEEDNAKLSKKKRKASKMASEEINGGRQSSPSQESKKKSKKRKEESKRKRQEEDSVVEEDAPKHKKSKSKSKSKPKVER